MLSTPIKNTLSMALGLGLLTACNNPVTPLEDLRVTLSSSLLTSVVISKPTQIQFTVSATSGAPITKLELYKTETGVSDQKIEEQTSQNSYTFNYGVTSGDGKIGFYAKAYDSQSRSQKTASKNYIITIDTPPVVTPNIYALRQVNLNIVSNAQCDTAYGGGITSSMVCATAPQKDSCQGDSGGPLVSKQATDWVQLGIVSFGIGCANAQYPGVYTRTDQYLNWILNKTGPLITNRIRPKIVGGTQAAAGSYPFMVALLVKGYPHNYDAQFCGASLIGSKWILTAAHCATGLPSQIWALLGTQDLALGGTQAAVKRMIVHENYNSVTTENDIALLELVSEVTTIPTVSLPTAALSLYNAGNSVTVIGWGETVAKAN
jgi:secreted trypsin-like serine protease